MLTTLFSPELIIEVTNVCNMLCKGCYAPNIFSSKISSNDANVKHLTLQKLRDEWPFKETLRAVSVRGGEPFLNPEIVDIILFLISKSQKVFVETNGFWIRDNYNFYEALKADNLYIKISSDKMHNSNIVNLSKKVDILEKNKIKFCIAITAETEEKFSLEASEIQGYFQCALSFIWHPKALDVNSLPKPKLGVINSNGKRSNSLTSKFDASANALPSVLLIIFTFVFIATSSFAREKILIGLASNFSESSTSNSNPYGNYFLDGVNLALKHHEVSILKQNIEVEFLKFDYGNNQSNVDKVISAAVNSKVIAILGYNYSSHALIASPIHVSSEVPMISISGTATRLLSFPRYIHTTCFDNSIMGKALADLATNQVHAKHVGIITASDCAYCVDLTYSFKTFYQTGKNTKITEFKILDSDSDFTDLIKEIKKAERIDAFLIPNHELTSAKVIHSLLENGFKATFLGGDGWGDSGKEFFPVINNKTFHGYSLTHWNKEQNNIKTLKFTSEYRNLYRKDPTDTSALAYDAMSFLLSTIISEKAKDRKTLENALSRNRHYKGVTGSLNLENGKVISKTVFILESKNSKFNFLYKKDYSNARR